MFHLVVCIYNIYYCQLSIFQLRKVGVSQITHRRNAGSDGAAAPSDGCPLGFYNMIFSLPQPSMAKHTRPSPVLLCHELLFMPLTAAIEVRAVQNLAQL